MIEATASTRTNFPTETLEIKSLKRAIITKSSLVITAKGLSRDCLFENLPASFKKNIRVTAIGALLKNGFHRLKGENYYSVFNLWGTGYHHWLTEVAIKLVLFEKELKSGIVLIPANHDHFIQDFFSLFDFKTEIFEGNSYIRNLKLITNPNSGHYHGASLQKLRDRLFEKLSVKKTSKRKIYISRKNSRARKVINEDELVDYLKTMDFECLELDNIPFAEQVEIFYNCEQIVSIHGAGLTNCIFMPEGSKIVELFPEISNAETELNACYYRLSGALGHNHNLIFCKREFPENKFYLDEDNIYADLKQLETVLK